MSKDIDKTQIDPSGGPQAGVKMKLGPYETTEILGRGGMAVVYKGMQQSLGRIVAIKVLPKEFSRDRQFVGRFHREAESVAKLNHPNIIQIIDKGEENGICFFVMEYVKGTSLGARLANKGVTFKELIEIGLQVCSALHYAHEQGVVHRDIKPANILLDDTTGIAKVADFGIAQLAEKSTAIGTLTGDHMAMGTLDYMSPEQKRDAKNVDRRADIYSIGVMLYEMSTGRVPMGIFDPPSRIHKELPKDFDVIVMRCLRDKPDERYQTCLELAGALAALPQSPSTMVRVMTSVKSGVTNIGTQIGRRNPRYIAAVFFLLVGLGVGTFAIWKWGKGEKETKGSGPVAGDGKSGGGETVKPPVDPGGGTTTVDAEAEFMARMRDAAEKAAGHDYKGANEIYDRLRTGATAAHAAAIDRAFNQAKQDEDDDEAEAFLGRLHKVPAGADSVTALDALLTEARREKVRQDVLNEIESNLALAKTAAQNRDNQAAEDKRKHEFENAAAHIQKLLDQDDLKNAGTELDTLSKGAVLKAENDECGRLTAALSKKRKAAASADENRRTFEAALLAATDLLKEQKFNLARNKLSEAEGASSGPEDAERIKTISDNIKAGELAFLFAQRCDNALQYEISEPLKAAKLYRDAAEGAPTPALGEAVIAKAVRLEKQAAEAASQQEYEGHIAAARKAAGDLDWKTSQDEAVKALALHHDDAVATQLLNEARKALTEKPPDPPKLIGFKFKGIAKWKFGNVKSVAVAPSGAVYTLDAGSKPLKIVRLDADLQFNNYVPLTIKYPDRIFVDGKGQIWASEWGNLSTINLMNPETLTIDRSVGGFGNNDGKFNYLVDIVVSQDGNSIFGLETGHSRLQKIATADGAFLSRAGGEFSGKGSSAGLFKAAHNLAIDKQGRVYASDGALRNIQRFKPDGSFDSVFMATPDFEPGAMAWAGNRLYVVDLTTFRVQVYSPEGKLLGTLGEKGKLDGQFLRPTGVAATEAGKVYVVDYGTRISLWEEDK